jgi:hypoxanthine phosphoribosyltransferase
MKRFDYSYDNYCDDFSTIVYAIEKSNIKYDLVVGIERGGLVLGVHLSNALNIPYASLIWSNHIGKVRDSSNPHLITALDKNKRVLIVDDICDTGTSLNDITKTYKGVDTATLIYNNINKCNFTPTYFGWEINRNDIPEWIDFWWEKK